MDRGKVNGSIIGEDEFAAISAEKDVTIDGTVGNITGGDSGAGISAVGNVTISGTVKGNITGDYGIYADDGNIDISGTVKGNIAGSLVGIHAEDHGSVTISGTVNGDITGGGDNGIYAGRNNVVISGTVKGEISGGKYGIMGGGSVTISGTVNGEIASTDIGSNSHYAIFAISELKITNNDIKVLDDGEEESEIQQYADGYWQVNVWSVMAKGKMTPAKKVKLVRSISNTLVPLIPQVNVPVYRLPEYIEAEEVIEGTQPEEVPGDVADVEEAVPDIELAD